MKKTILIFLMTIGHFMAFSQEMSTLMFSKEVLEKLSEIHKLSVQRSNYKNKKYYIRIVPISWDTLDLIMQSYSPEDTVYVPERKNLGYRLNKLINSSNVFVNIDSVSFPVLHEIDFWLSSFVNWGDEELWASDYRPARGYYIRIVIHDRGKFIFMDRAQ